MRRSSPPPAKGRFRACRANRVFLHACSFLLGLMLAAALLSCSGFMSPGADDPRVEGLNRSRDGIRGLIDLRLLLL